MNILLIKPPAIDEIVADMSDYFDSTSGSYPPLGLMYLASYLRRNDGNRDIRILDAYVSGSGYEEIERTFRNCRPDLVGITALTFNLRAALKTAEIVKRIDDGIVTVLGGPHVTIYPEETLRFSQVDLVVLGEGERAFDRLVTALESSAPLDGLDAVGYKENGRIRLNRYLLLEEDLDSLPFPAMDLVDHTKYFSVLSPEERAMVMMSSRGCPFKCVYCDRPHLGKKFRSRSAANVVDEMESYLERYGIRSIKFFDDTFTVDRRRAMEIAEEIIRRKLKVSWSVRARVNTVDRETLSVMRRAGLDSISFGIESGNQQILDNLKKGIRLEQVAEAVSCCRRLGIEVLGDFIIGNPGEKREQIEETMRFSQALGLDYAQFTVMTPYPATELYRNGMESGVITRDYWRDFAENPSDSFATPVWEENFSKRELVGLLKKAYRSFYFRPRYVLRRAARIGSAAELMKKLKIFVELVKLNFMSKATLTENFKRRIR
jgi:anaerobic magnesium-protoporphyrin IX monomethyl ester cyclase